MKLPLDAALAVRTRALFAETRLGLEWRRFELGTGRLGGPVPEPVRKEPWDHFLRVAGEERAAIEMLDEVPATLGFDHADEIFQGLSNLRPRLVTQLLEACRSVRAKRLFFILRRSPRPCLGQASQSPAYRSRQGQTPACAGRPARRALPDHHSRFALQQHGGRRTMTAQRYLDQVALLLRTIPEIASEPDFALRGGTAINLFVRDLPRLSADDEYLSARQSFTASRELDRPIELYVLPDEHHVKWQPAHRIAVYNRAIDWFDYWLNANKAPSREEEVARWEAMRAALVRRAAGSEAKAP
jgi:hypothetical protein